MQTIAIRHHITGAHLYGGSFPDIRRAVEQAAADGVDLSGADLRHARLGNAALDGLVMRGARLDGANLAGANMSEARLDGTVFTGAALHNACLCLSGLTRCDFTAALFGATDITGARIDRSRFSTPSAFTLNFREAESFDGCLYFDEAMTPCPFSRPPLVISGLAKTIAVMDRHVLAGAVAVEIAEFLAQAYIGMKSLQA